MKTIAPLLLDAYKIGHPHQYPKNTQQVCSNFTPRKTRRSQKIEKVMLFGLQYCIQKYLIDEWNDTFFNQPLDKVMDLYAKRLKSFLNLTDDQLSIEHVKTLHKIGYLPIEIWALPEGTLYNLNVPGFVVFTTSEHEQWLKDSGVMGWVTNTLETIISTSVWGPCTSATTAFYFKKLLNEWSLKTAGSTDFVPWQGHDFSMRGMFGLEAAQMSGAGHLVSFTGTDTVPALDFVDQYYDADSYNKLVGGSVNATEHAVSSCNIGLSINTYDQTINMSDRMNMADVDFFKRMIVEVCPTGIVSIVSDTFDYWNTVTNTLKVVKDLIMNRDGKVVIRPDTGDPVHIVAGYDVFHPQTVDPGYSMHDLFEDAEIALNQGKDAIYDPASRNTYPIYLNDKNEIIVNDAVALTLAEISGSISCLWDIFGGTITNQGYRVLDPHIGLIYGDSITYDRAERICKKLAAKGFASTNLVYGIGSYTYQMVTRDTDGYAIKATWALIDGQGIDIYKDPKTDDGTKKSAKGLTAVYKTADGFELKDCATWDDVKNCAFVQVFKNGHMTKRWTFEEIRNTAASYL